MRKLLLCFCLVLAGCNTPIMNTGQEITVELIGTEEAYCIISTDVNRYALDAPGTVFVERSFHDLKIDCDDNYSDRRRVAMIESQFGFGYWKHPKRVVVDFSTLDNGTRFSDYRADAPVMLKRGTPDDIPIAASSFDDVVINEVLTEDSFSLPVKTTQDYPVKKDHYMGRRSYPVIP